MIRTRPSICSLSCSRNIANTTKIEVYNRCYCIDDIRGCLHGQSLHLDSHRDELDINKFLFFHSLVEALILFSSGNLTKHMKSKAHGKRCPEGTAPGPVQCELETDEGGEKLVFERSLFLLLTKATFI